MNGGQFVAVVALMIPITAIVMHNLTKMRAQKSQGLPDGLAGELMDRADNLDERVRQLEAILDAEAPGWRSRHR